MSLFIVKILLKIDNSPSYKFQGTAFFINNNTLVTARHVVAIDLKVGYEIYLGNPPDSGKLLISKSDIIVCERDIAILRTKKKFLEIQPIEFTEVPQSKEVEVRGFYKEHGSINSFKHHVSGYRDDEHTYEVQHHLIKGLSGSPVLFGEKVCGTYADPIQCC